MMFSNHFMRAITATIGILGCLSGQMAFAQTNPTTVDRSDAKIRNIDGVAAVVNTGYVTRKEIDDRIAALPNQGAKLSDAATLRKNALERLDGIGADHAHGRLDDGAAANCAAVVNGPVALKYQRGVVDRGC